MRLLSFAAHLLPRLWSKTSWVVRADKVALVAPFAKSARPKKKAVQIPRSFFVRRCCAVQQKNPYPPARSPGRCKPPAGVAITPRHAACQGFAPGNWGEPPCSLKTRASMPGRVALRAPTEPAHPPLPSALRPEVFAWRHTSRLLGPAAPTAELLARQSKRRTVLLGISFFGVP